VIDNLSHAQQPLRPVREVSEVMREEGAALPRFSMADRVDISVIVVNYNTAHLLERCIDALRIASAGLEVGMVIVDNASRDDSVAVIRRLLPDGTLIQNTQNVGFGRANNQALAHCSGRYVLLLNSDAFVLADTLRVSLAYMDATPACGVLGVQSVDEAGRRQFAGRIFPTPWQDFILHTGLFSRLALPHAVPHQTLAGNRVVDSDWVVGCYYMVRQEVIKQVGLFDPRYFLYFEEVDHCRAVKAAGWKVECLLDTSVIHEGGASAESEGPLGAGRQIAALQVESGLLYFRKHGGLPGVLVAIGLSIATDLVLAAKWLLKRRPLSGLASYWQSTSTWCRLSVATRLGTRPTR
jgi:N-acetylglucosaminyl-diphospho-decaprenol L-rhamnosyltransferase